MKSKRIGPRRGKAICKVSADRNFAQQYGLVDANEGILSAPSEVGRASAVR
jgi:hypothetical protein